MINLRSPQEILNTPHYIVTNAQSLVYRDGIPLEKGAVLTPRKLEEKEDFF